jgi:4-amino-4-deoxy-L-arabinose transferase-like glycosyltransferase
VGEKELRSAMLPQSEPLAENAELFLLPHSEALGEKVAEGRMRGEQKRGRVALGYQRYYTPPLTFRQRRNAGSGLMPAQTMRHVLLIVLLSGLCFFTRLGSSRLWDQDEPRNARCAWEMYERNDWIVPTFNGQLRAHKPILLYWLMMSAYAVFGVNEFSARFWSAGLAVGTVLLTYGIGVRLFDARTAIWAATGLATTLMFNVAAHAATPDSTLIFCSTVSIALFVCSVNWLSPRATTVGDGRPACLRLDRRWLAAAGMALGLGVLAKGPVGFVLPVVVWCLFLWWSLYDASVSTATPSTAEANEASWHARIRSRLAPRFRLVYLLNCMLAWRPFLVTSLMLLVAVPWYVLVGQRTEGAWLREFFWQHNLGRAVESMEGHQGNILFYYPASILVGFFPWSALAIPVAIWIAGRWNEAGKFDPRFALLLAWLAGYVVPFSLAATKLPSYVTPTYPALALMVGHFVANWPASSVQPARWWPRWSAITMITVGLLVIVTLAVAAHEFLPGEELLAAIGLILLCGGAACLASFRRWQFTAGMMRLSITSLCFIVAIFGWVAPRVSRHQQINRLLAVAQQLDANAPLASYGVHEPSWVFYAGRTIPLLPGHDPAAVQQLLGRQRGLLITTPAHYDRLRAKVPLDATVLSEVPYFLKGQQLVLVGASSRRNALSTRNKRQVF